MKTPVFISMTVISSRLGKLDRVLSGLLNQTHRPDRIILNISIEPYMLDEGIRFEQLPHQTRKWVLAGAIELYFCENTGPYRKILPTLERFSNIDCLIATADDDVQYPPEWLDQLVQLSTTHNAVAAYRCRVMELHDHSLKPYKFWGLVGSYSDLISRGINPSVPQRILFPTGRDGIIYHSSHLKDFHSLSQLAKIAPGQDDVALKFLTLVNGIPVIVAERQRTSFAEGLDFPEVPGTGISLWSSNATGNNDIAISAVLDWCRQNFGFGLNNIAEPPVK